MHLHLIKRALGLAPRKLLERITALKRFFLCVMHSHIQIMVRRAGQPQGWPGSRVTGSANPVRLTTHEISTSAGELINLSLEDVIMATTLSHPFSP